MKAKKVLIFSAIQGHFLKDIMGLAECHINQIGVNFHPPKSLEFFENYQLTKSDPKKHREWKVPSLMPIWGKKFITTKQVLKTVRALLNGDNLSLIFAILPSYISLRHKQSLLKYQYLLRK